MREAQYYRLNDLRHRITEAMGSVFLTCALSLLLSADLLCFAVFVLTIMQKLSQLSPS
jgi:hypothetical protein